MGCGRSLVAVSRWCCRDERGVCDSGWPSCRRGVDVGRRHCEASDGYGVDFVHTATLAHDVPGVPNLAAYVEYIGVAPHDTGATYQAIASGGLTYALSDDWMLDFGGTIGISDSADDFTIFAGTSFRF